MLKGQSQYTPYSDTADKGQMRYTVIYDMHCEGFPPLFISFVAQFRLSLYPLALGAAESRDELQQNTA